MLTVFTRHRSLVLSMLLLAIALWSAMLPRQAQRARAGDDAPSKPTLRYYGVSECARCHKTPVKDEPAPLLCQCNEYLKWSEDKHREAFTALAGNRAQAMGKLLKIPDVTTATECTCCHGIAVTEPTLLHKSFKREDGVSCVVCHGPYKEWIDKHGGVDREEWRQLSREVKEQKYGMRDLWDPAKRAHLCLSCHLGDREGKFVTHDMLAAGHPPLPGIEAATFSDQMPRHWQYLREKDKKVQELLHFDGKEREQTKLVLVAGVVNLAQEARMLAGQAEECLQAPEPNGRSLDWASFECFACHHDLKTPNWRQLRGYRGKPGRPPMPSWPAALVKLAIHHTAADDAAAAQLTADFTKALGKVSAAFDAQPFGDPALIAPAAKDLAKWAEDMARTVAAKPCDEAAGRKLLRRLTKQYRTELVDYDSARQVTWAFRIMYGELEPMPAPEIKETLDKLSVQLKLELPAGKERSIEKELKQSLEVRNRYDAEELRKAFSRLAERLEK
jgi:hypothetical protein